jgi:hypothetical protein
MTTQTKENKSNVQILPPANGLTGKELKQKAGKTDKNGRSVTTHLNNSYKALESVIEMEPSYKELFQPMIDKIKAEHAKRRVVKSKTPEQIEAENEKLEKKLKRNREALKAAGK